MAFDSSLKCPGDRKEYRERERARNKDGEMEMAVRAIIDIEISLGLVGVRVVVREGGSRQLWPDLPPPSALVDCESGCIIKLLYQAARQNGSGFQMHFTVITPSASGGPSH